MSIWNKVLLGLIAVAALAFWYFSMRTLKTHQYWRQLAAAHEKRIAATVAENQAMAEGAVEGEQLKDGIKQYQMKIAKLLVDRGRVWSNVAPQNFNASGQGTIVTDQPNPNGIAPKSILHLFEEKEADAAANGGRYLGEFEVEAVADNQVQVKPTMKLSARQLQRLTQPSQPWIVYEKMPADNHEALADLTEAEKKKMLPAESVASYAHDGEPATSEQIEQWNAEGVLVDDEGKIQVDADGKPIAGAKGTFVRRLNDYGTIFRRRSQERTVMLDGFEVMQRDIRYLQQSVAEAKEQVVARQRQIDSLKTELAEVNRERGAVVKHFTALKERTAAVEAMVKQLLDANKQIAAQIATIQLDAARQIDARTRAMAQAQESSQ